MYHILGLIIFFPSFFSIFQKKIENSKSLVLFFILSLFMLASIRYHVGTDYYSYYKFFNNINPFKFESNYITGTSYNFEPLFLYITAILKNLIISPYFYFSFFSFFTLLLVFKGITILSPHYLLSIFLFYSHFYANYTYNGIRQGIVMGFFLISLKYIIDKKLLSTIAITIIAIMFHKSGALILISYFLSKIDFKNRLILILGIITSILIWKLGIGERLFTLVTFQFPQYHEYLRIYIELFYTEHTLFNVLQRILIIIPLIFYYPELSKNNQFTKLFSIYFFGIIIYFIFGFFSIFMTRINMFFRIIEILLIPIFYQSLKSKKQKILVLIVIGIWSFVILANLYYNEDFYPFRTLFGVLF